MAKQRVMLDTSAINAIVNKIIDDEFLASVEAFQTHVQVDELGRTKDSRKAAQLLEKAHEIAAKVPTTTAVWGDSRWGEAKWSDGSRYIKMLKRHVALDLVARKRPRDPMNQSRDVRIAETAIDEACILISGDKELIALIREFDGEAVDFRVPSEMAQLLERKSQG